MKTKKHRKLHLNPNDYKWVQKRALKNELVADLLVKWNKRLGKRESKNG